MVDESTDVAVEKLVAVCIQYFSEKSREILTAFLGFYPAVQALSEALTECLQSTVWHLPIELAKPVTEQLLWWGNTIVCGYGSKKDLPILF